MDDAKRMPMADVLRYISCYKRLVFALLIRSLVLYASFPMVED